MQVRNNKNQNKKHIAINEVSILRQVDKRHRYRSTMDPNKQLKTSF